MDRHHRNGSGQGQDVLQRVRREGRWWWLQARHARRIWRWALLAAFVLFVALVALRRPLADWFWQEPRIEQLLEQGDAALAAGRLSNADGSGAREYYQAALALDTDRSQAREGLARTGGAALQAARRALADGDIGGAEQALMLARQLQVPRADSDAVALAVRERRAAAAGLDTLLENGRRALREGRLDDGPDSALPLLQRVLDLRPGDLTALEAREDALTDLLSKARQSSDAGDIVAAAALLRRAQVYDAGHVDLPASQEALSRAVERSTRAVAAALRRGRLDTAVAKLQLTLEAAADEPVVAAQRERLVAALLRDCQQLAGDFNIDAALARVSQIQRLQGTPRELALAQQEIDRARAAQQSVPRARAGTAAGRRDLERLLQRVAAAESRGQLISPPGTSAYDALREAQAVAPRDRRVVAAAARLLLAGRSCFEEALTQNRVEGAGACLQAWQTLAPSDTALGPARNRLAQRWLAVGSERLGRGDLAYAERAAAQARLLQPTLSELPAFEARVQQAGGQSP